MTQQEALQTLNTIYAATRVAPLNANDHEAILKMAQELAKYIQPEEPKAASGAPASGAEAIKDG